MRRRDFIKVVAGSAAAWPLEARAQQAAPMRRIGVLLRVANDDPDAQRDLQAFRDGLQALGWSVDKTYSSNIAMRAPIPPKWISMRKNW